MSARQTDAKSGQPQAVHAPVPPVAPAIFASLTEVDLLNIGAPADWIADIKGWTEERSFQMSDRLPAEVAEALLDYAATGRLPTPEPAPADTFAHPDTLRRVQTITSEEELRLALDFPWDKWSVFLHPSQRDVVDRDFSGPARVTGTAGTGKTIVALHRAARAVREDPQARVLLTSFSRPLANSLRAKLAILLADDPAKLARVSNASFEDAASELFQLATGRRPTMATIDAQQVALERAIADLGYKDLSPKFVFSEWRQIVDAWNLPDLASYTTVPRIGRRNRLGSKQRETVWPVFDAARAILSARGLLTSSQLFATAEATLKENESKPFTQALSKQMHRLCERA